MKGAGGASKICCRVGLPVSGLGVLGRVTAVRGRQAMGAVERYRKTSAGRSRLLCAVAVAAGLFVAGSSRADMVALSPSFLSPGVWALPPDVSSPSLLTQAGNAETSVPLASPMGLAGTASAMDALGSPLSPASAFGQPAASLPDGVSHDQPGIPAGQKIENLPASPSSLAVALSSLLTLGSWRLIRQARQVHLVCLPEWYHEGGPGQVGYATPLELGKSLNLLPICWYQPAGMGVSPRPTAYYSRPERCSAWDSLYFIPTSAPRSPPNRF